MNLDNRIKDALADEADSIDEILNDKQGLFDMVLGTFKSGLGVWVWAVNIITLIVTGLMVWSGYEFFTASQQADQVYWGICTLITLSAQIALKQWIWMEMNRGSLLREIKRVEIAVVKLNSKVNSKLNME